MAKIGECWRCKKTGKIYLLKMFSGRVLMVCNFCKGILCGMNKDRQEKADRAERELDWHRWRELSTGPLPTMDEQERRMR